MKISWGTTGDGSVGGSSPAKLIEQITSSSATSWTPSSKKFVVLRQRLLRPSGCFSIAQKRPCSALLRGTLQRILAHRERVLQIEAELKQITWLEPVLSTEKR
jgi:hypothetical protein